MNYLAEYMSFCFGDLLLLPPVKGNQPFIPVTFLEAKTRLGAVGSVDLWKTFLYFFSPFFILL